MSIPSVVTILALAVLGVWLVQASVGVALALRVVRRGGRLGPPAIVHISLLGTALVLWVVFVLGGVVLVAWIAFALVTVGNGFGDAMLVQRWRRQTGTHGGFWSDYGKTVSAAMRGALPRLVVFHALFSGVVYFSCLAACILATVSAPAVS